MDYKCKIITTFITTIEVMIKCIHPKAEVIALMTKNTHAIIRLFFNVEKINR